MANLDNCLIIDLENGTDYVPSMSVKVNNVKEWKQLAKTIIENGKPYKFIAIDTLTALEEFAKPAALAMYLKSPSAAKGFNSTNVLEAPHGAGYGFVREAMEKLLDIMSEAAPNIILIGHVKDAAISDDDSSSIKDLDLAGKAKRVFSAKSDAIGYVHRDENSNLCLNFQMGGEVYCGARPEHLANKDIIVSERLEDGTFVSHWDRIYPSLKTK